MKYTKCDNCGATYRFDANSGNLKCTKCGSEVVIEKSGEVPMHDMSMKEALDEADKSSVGGLKCANCGATFEGTADSMSLTCKYCGAHLVQDLSNNQGLQPDGVIPFAFDESKAIDIFMSGIRRKHFVPNKIKKDKSMYQVESLYIPAFSFDARTTNQYDGKLYNIEKDYEGNKHTTYRSISGVLDVRTDNILIECSNYLVQEELQAIRPFPLSKCYKYDEGFIMGYSLEYYNRRLSEIRSIAKSEIYKDVRSKILSRYSYDGVQYLNINTTYNSCRYSHLVLPTYRVKYTYKKKEYHTFMNGQTGKVGKNVPRSGLKIFALVMGILATIGGIVGIIVASVR